MSDATVPLCLAFDGTLTPIDTLYERLLAFARAAPASLLVRVRGSMLRGRAALAQELTMRTQMDVGSLPLRTELLDWLKSERAHGRRLALVATADCQVAADIACHLGLFDEIIFTEGAYRLTGEATRRALVERFGEKGFDYAGSRSRDEIVWRSARHAIVVGTPAMVDRARRVSELERVFPAMGGGLAAWLRAVRLYQWVKNVLVFLPALLAHRIAQPPILFRSVMAFIAFGLCASSVYLVNDLLDLTSDRSHVRKRRRPFAAGTLSARSGLVVALALLGVAFAVAVLAGGQFVLVLGGYFVLTWAYSLRLKRAVLVDVMMLAGLYTIRIVAGSAATSIPLSFWLLAFSVFMFLSLGFVKRYTELYGAVQAGTNGGRGRGYSPSDLPLLLNLGTASGYCTVVVMALYINSPDSQALYRHHKPLWLACPLLLYWISRIWLVTTRGNMHDDPVVYALRDRISVIVLVLLGLSMLAAT